MFANALELMFLECMTSDLSYSKHHVCHTLQGKLHRCRISASPRDTDDVVFFDKLIKVTD